MFSIGIDPGSRGALGAISKDRNDVRLIKFADHSHAEIHEALEELYLLRGIGNAVLEQVSSRPTDGVASVFKFGTAYGFVRGLLAAYRIGYDLVIPQVWQRGMALGGFQNNRKKASKEKAQILFPHIKGITQETGDAMLIAEYAWRKVNL